MISQNKTKLEDSEEEASDLGQNYLSSYEFVFTLL